MEPGELSDLPPQVSTINPQRMEQRLSHMRRWVNHLVGKVRNLGHENSMLRELTYWQAKRIERLEEGVLVSYPPPCSHQLLGTDESAQGCSRVEDCTDMPPVQGDTPGPPCVGYRHL